MSSRRAEVWYEDRRVGMLNEGTRGEILYAYDADWLDDGFPISITLPLANADRLVDGFSFFEGLLPEGGVRRRIARQHGVDESDTLGLLLKIGTDCAGALSILPEGADARPEMTVPVRLDDAALAALVRVHGDAGLLPDAAPQRFSLAGAQEKLTVILDAKGYALSNRANPSSHILKFETVPRVCLAESLGNAIFREAGLSVVETEFLRLPDIAEPYLRIRRYDRGFDGGFRWRLHQEDLIQAVGEISPHKYEAEGGPSLATIAQVLREHVARPAEDIARLRDWQIMNFLIGNWDGHGKNLALSYRPGSAVPELAPFYDIVAIEFLNLVGTNAWSRAMAFAVGGEHLPERIGPTEWRRAASELGIPARTLLARVGELATALPEIAEQACAVHAEVHGTGDDGVLAQLVESVRTRCRWALHNLH